MNTLIFEKLFVKIKHTCFRKFGLFIVRRIPIKAPLYSPKAIASILSYAKTLVHNMKLPIPLSNWVCSSITARPMKIDTMGRVLRGAHARRGLKKTETLLRRLPRQMVQVGSQVVGVSLAWCTHLVKKTLTEVKKWHHKVSFPCDCLLLHSILG